MGVDDARRVARAKNHKPIEYSAHIGSSSLEGGLDGARVSRQPQPVGLRLAAATVAAAVAQRGQPQQWT